MVLENHWLEEIPHYAVKHERGVCLHKSYLITKQTGQMYGKT